MKLASHDSDKLFQCPRCDKGFSSETSLKGHVNGKSCKKVSNEKEIKVEDEEVTYNKKGNVTTDSEIELQSISFWCRICDKRFDTKKVFTTHMFNTHVKVIRCEICDKEFKNKLQMEDHIKDEHSYNPFDCDICKKNFSKQEYYELHITLGYCTPTTWD
jgi:KRAB domain-containing zinc finger protein